jgi:hypothetical protein
VNQATATVGAFKLVTPCPSDALYQAARWVCAGLQEAFDDATRPASPGEFVNQFRQAQRGGLGSIAVSDNGGLACVILARPTGPETVEVGILSPRCELDALMPALQAALAAIFDAGATKVQARFQSRDTNFGGLLETLGAKHDAPAGTGLFFGRPRYLALASIERADFEKTQTPAGVM